MIRSKPSKEEMAKATIPKLNSSLFTAENYNVDNRLVLDEYKMTEYTVGWCWTDELSMCFNTTFNREIVVMYEVPEGEFYDSGKYWFHLPLESFIMIFIPDYCW